MKPGEMIFGTDGVRDVAGQGLLDPASVARIGRACASVLGTPERFPEDFPPEGGGGGGRRNVLIGWDTRQSGPEIAGALGRAFRQAGFPVVHLGVIPTPGVARLASLDPRAVLGVMVSASHNPAEYNGIKFLSPGGAKASVELEEAVSAAYWRGEEPPRREEAPLREDPEGLGRYVDSLLERSRRPERLRGMRVVLDTAQGAAYLAAPRLFRALGADVRTIGDRPDGRNINAGCGALHPQGLAREVAAAGADLGFSFDGDGDRMIPVASDGSILDGDNVLAITGPRFFAEGKLPLKTVVATVMSNLGLEKALGARDLRLLRTPVGDRHVYREMVRGGHPIGGEQSGHLIFLADSRTGDGILAAIRLIDCLAGDGRGLAEEARAMTRYPQVLLNFKVPRKVAFEALPRVGAALAQAEAALRGEGRILLRYSGTEPLARVMVEGPEKSLIEGIAREIGDSIVESIR
jgi:phosphoglucosamine mutase